MVASRGVDRYLELLAKSIAELYLLRAYAAMALYVSSFLIYSMALGLALRALARRRGAALVEGVPVVYLKRDLLTSFTVSIWRPIIFIAPRHRDDPVILAHELGHAKSPYFSYTRYLFWMLLLLFFGAMYGGDGEHFLAQATVWALGFGIGVILSALFLLPRDELFADAYAIKRLGDAALEERARWRHEDWAGIHNLKGLARRWAIWSIHIFFPGIPRDLEGIREYLRDISRDPLKPIGHFSLIAPWLAVYSGTFTYLAGVVYGIADARLLLMFAIFFLAGMVLSYLLALALKPVVAKFAKLDPFKISLMLASSFLGTASLASPGILLASPEVFAPIAFLLTLLVSISIARIATDKPYVFALISTAILYGISILIGLTALWRAHLL